MVLSNIYSEKLRIQISYDVSQNIEYVGKARPDTLDDEAGWAISLIEYDVNGNITDLTMANGDNTFNKKWTLRASYSYS